MIEEIVDDNAAVNFKFKFSQQPGRFIITLKNISKAYGPLELLKNTSVSIERGDKIALIGANGKGKSTLLRIVSGTAEAVEGERVMGYNVIQAFFAQHQLESLHLENEILEELKQAGSGKTEQELRNVLGCFLFTDEEVFKKIKVLSGGEKSRVALAKTLISEANFLLLDEPTNHLDFISENILIQALQQYIGTFVVVSHNRHFVSQVANKIWYIEDKQIKEYPGTFDEYEYWRKKNEAALVPQDVPKREKKSDSKPAPAPVTPSTQATLKLLEKDLRKIEDVISALETQKATSEADMARPEVFSNKEQLQKSQAVFRTADEELRKANKKWEEIATAIDTISNS
jgi:ATP-binding cassette subfamily F protein 3